MRPHGMMRGAAASAVDFLLPWTCIFCHSASRQRAAANSVCVDCVQELTPVINNSCLRCGASVGPHAATDDGCVHCRRQPIRFGSVVCLGMYDEAMRKAILASKWSYSAIGIRSLARLLAAERLEALQAVEADIVIPVPQHWVARIRRRFNPAAIIAETVASGLKIEDDQHILRRRRMTRPQKRVSVQERYRNQRASFWLRDTHLLRGKRVLLVDDVLTTGATCSEAARLLKQHGAASCHVAIIARVLGAG